MFWFFFAFLSQGLSAAQHFSRGQNIHWMSSVLKRSKLLVVSIDKIKKATPSYLCLKHPVKNLLSINEVKKVFGLINFQKLNFPNFPFQKKVERLINVNVIAEFFLSFPVKT